jgi:hypothetical protein
MSVGVMKDQKLKFRNLHVSHTLDDHLSFIKKTMSHQNYKG